MVPLIKFFVWILAWPKITVYSSIMEPCSTNAIVDLTRETADPLGFVIKDSHVFSPEVIWSIDGKTFGCLCGSNNKTCLRLCCPFGKVQIYGSCVENNAISGILPRVTTSIDGKESEEMVLGKNSDLYIDDPCDYDWMTSSVTEHFHVLPNGSIYAPDWGGLSALSNFEHYCLFRESNSTVYSAKVCRPWLENVHWDVFCMAIATVVMIVIFVAYTVVPELKNLHGMMIRSYLVSYVFVYICATVVLLTAESKPHAKLFTFFLFAMEYWSISCVFWLNVISFDTWKAIRSIQSIDFHNPDSKKQKFIRYAIYAWITPAFLISPYAAAMSYVPHLRDILVRQYFRQFGRIGVKSSIFVCNTFFYLSTALLINRHKRDMVTLAESVKKHHDAGQQWINLHVQLYLIMGGHMIPWIIWDLWLTPETTSALVTLEMLQSFLLFFVLLWKDNVKRSLRNLFGRRPPRQLDVAVCCSTSGS